MPVAPRGVRAIVFDTFGTVVDWRKSIAEDLSAWGAAQGLSADWTGLADLWRSRYDPQKDRVRLGQIPWTNLDDLHYAALCEILPGMGLGHLTEAQRWHITYVWRRLYGWPDAVAGLTRLKPKFILGPLSNGNIALLVNMAKYAGLPWDCIFSAEHFEHYKPHPDTYLGVCRQLRLEPAQVMMCAAHNNDLRAARAQGLATGYIARPTEYGPRQAKDLRAEEDWDVIATDLEDFAGQMGA
ncbi:MAG: haloacid dehalogenase type II [Pseudomonadota bacterium]